MPLADRLAAAVTREAAQIDATVEAFVLDLGDVLVSLNAQIRVLLDEFDATDGRLVQTAANLGRAVRLRDELRASLTRAGWDEVVAAAVDAPLDTLAQAVVATSRIANDAARLTPLDVDALAAFKELRLADLLDVGDDLLRTVWRSVLDGVTGTRPVRDLVADIARATDLSKRQARTVYDTAVSTYVRQADQLLGTGEPGESFLYVGPLDGITRPFCRTWVGKVRRRDEIEALDNGQLGNSMLTAGGYNCRHRWLRVSKFDPELQRIAGTDERVSWVRDYAPEEAA